MKRLYKIGLIAQDTNAGIKTCAGYAQSGNYTTLQMPIGTFYQVALDKIYSIGEIHYNGDTVGSDVQIGYGDTSVNNSAVPPTNNVNLTDLLPIEVANRAFIDEIYLEILAGKYPYIRAIGGEIYCHVMGIEK